MPEGQKLGKVISCRNHVNYFVSVYREGDISPCPGSDDYALGRYVRIGDGEAYIAGIVISTQIISDEGLKVGQHSHSMPSRDLSVFTPELMDGAVNIIAVRGIGVMDEDGIATLGIPPIAPSFQDPVSCMTDDEISFMHSRMGKLHLEYLRDLRMKGDTETYSAVLNALSYLMEILPEHRPMINLIRQEIVWNTQMKG